MWVILAGLGAALLLGLGYVLQQHEAAAVPDERLRPALLVTLIRRPVWLAGIAVMVAGQALSALALRLGSLVLVEPLLATNMFFALPMAAVASRRRPSRADWVGAVAIVVGLGLLTEVDGGIPSAPEVMSSRWGTAALAIMVVAVAMALLAVRLAGRVRALLLATAAGTLFGLQDLLTQQVVGRLGEGLGMLLASWAPWTLLVVAIAGITLVQNAFSVADLTASLPALTLTEPLCGIVLAVTVLGQHLRTAAWPLAAGVVGLALLGAGLVLLTRSPLVLNPHNRPDRGAPG